MRANANDALIETSSRTGQDRRGQQRSWAVQYRRLSVHCTHSWNSISGKGGRRTQKSRNVATEMIFGFIRCHDKKYVNANKSEYKIVIKSMTKCRDEFSARCVSPSPSLLAEPTNQINNDALGNPNGDSTKESVQQRHWQHLTLIFMGRVAWH